MGLYDHEYELPADLSPRLELVLRRIQFSRRYMMSMLEGLEESDWFWMPDAYSTHIAWQVGHIAMSHYGLTLFRQRGRAEVDSSLMAGKFRKLFMKGTAPKTDPVYYPTSSEILEVCSIAFTNRRWSSFRRLKPISTNPSMRRTLRSGPSMAA